MSCAYYRIMGSYPAHINKVKGKVSWHYDYFLTVGAFIVKGSSKVKIVRFISCRSTHFVTSVINYIIFVGANTVRPPTDKAISRTVIFNITLFAVKINGVDLC